MVLRVDTVVIDYFGSAIVPSVWLKRTEQHIQHTRTGGQYIRLMAGQLRRCSVVNWSANRRTHITMWSKKTIRSRAEIDIQIPLRRHHSRAVVLSVAVRNEEWL